MLHTLKNSNFCLIITGKLISLMGDAVFDFAIIWFVLESYGTKSGTILALVMTMTILPKVVLGSLAGTIVDRYDKRWIMIGSDLVAGTAVLIVYILMRKGSAGIGVLLSVTALLSVTSTMVRITASSMIPELFAGKKVYDANSLNQFVERGTSLLGYAFGGGLVALAGANNVILLDAVSFVACAVLESFLRLSPKQKEKSLPGAKKHVMKIFTSDLLDVVGFLKSNPQLLHIVLIFTGTNFLLDPVLNIVMPYVLKNTFHVTSSEMGLVIAALPMGFCMGAIYFSRRPSFLMNRLVLFKSIFLLNLVSVALLLIFAMPGMLGTGWTATAYFIACLSIQGVFSAAINIATSSYLQQNVPDCIRGRFIGVSSSLSAGLIPLGSLIAGALIGILQPLWLFGFVVAAIFIMLSAVPRRHYSFDNIG